MPALGEEAGALTMRLVLLMAGVLGAGIVLSLLLMRRDAGTANRLAVAARTASRSTDPEAPTDPNVAANAAAEAQAAQPDIKDGPGIVLIGPDPVSKLIEGWVVGTGEPVSREFGKVAEVNERSAMILVLIPGGPAITGAQVRDPKGLHYDKLADSDESPVLTEMVDDFWISKYEMTQAQWMASGGDDHANPSRNLKNRVGRIDLRLPVENVSWCECVERLNRVNLGLPTELQWEYACRAGTDEPLYFHGTQARLRLFCNVAEWSYMWTRQGPYDGSYDDGYAYTAPVGRFLPNDFGLYDMYGNVGEWCVEEYRTRIRAAGDSDESNETWSSSTSPAMVYRGGSYLTQSKNVRSSNRLWFDAMTRCGYVGVRPVWRGPVKYR